MADVASKAPMRQPQHKAAEIDTTLPYQNVKAAVRMFGEKGDAKMMKSHEKHGAEMRKLKEDLAKARFQVADALKDKASALDDLKTLQEASQARNNVIAGCATNKESLSCTNEVHVALERELKVAQEQHTKVYAELEALKREMRKLEEELHNAVKDKENAMRQAEEALSAAEVNAKRAEELSKEIAGTKESLVLVKMACIEANKEREALLAARMSETSEEMCTHNTEPPPPPHGSPTNLNKLEYKLNAARSEFTIEELRMVRHNLVAARDALANIDKLKAGCGSPVTDATISIELEAAKAELVKALDNDALLESTLKGLQDNFKEATQELDLTKLELVEVRSREAHASSEVEVLKSELAKVKDELLTAHSCNEAFVGLSHKLQKMAAFEDENSLADDALMRKVNDEAKAELHAMLKEEAEAVRQAELRQKTSHTDQHVGNRDRLETLYEDRNVVLSKHEASNSSHTVNEEPLVNALDLRMRASDKEEHKKKKLLHSFSALLSRSKRSSRKATSPT